MKKTDNKPLQTEKDWSAGYQILGEEAVRELPGSGPESKAKELDPNAGTAKNGAPLSPGILGGQK